MSPRPRKENGPPPLESLPYELRMALVKLMGKENIDIKEAYERAAYLIDVNGKEFAKAVDRKSERKYKQRYMRGINATRNTIQRNKEKELLDKYVEGHGDGYVEGKNAHQIYYYCKGCQKRIDVYPGSESHKAIIKYMHDHGWAHQSCLNG